MQDCDPKAYMYMSSGRKDALIGRFSRASTVAPTVTAHWKANRHTDNALNQMQKKSLVRLRSSSCEATV